MRINEITSRHIKDYVDIKFESGRADGREDGLSIASLKKHKSILGMTFKEAMVDQLVDRNPVEVVSLPCKDDTESVAVFLTAEEANTMMQAFRGHELQPIVYRLMVAKHLLNPNDSVLIIAIDENETNHLGVLLEELFTTAKIQMVSIVINPKGRATNYFTRTDECLYFVFLGDASANTMIVSEGETEVRWPYQKRSDTDSTRGHRPRQFYPIYVNDLSRKIGIPISPDIDRYSVQKLDGCTTVFPVNEDGTEMEWGLTGGPLGELNDRGFVRVGKKRHSNPMPYSISYLSTEDVKKVDSGILKIVGERRWNPNSGQ